MKRKDLWISLSLVNLCIVALLGTTLRTKYLFSIPFIDYKNFLSAHSHFAFGGWVTLALMILYIDNMLTPAQKQKGIYQFTLWGIQTTSLGMVVSFPFHGYALFSIVFSTLFIFFTYLFSWVFISDLRKTQKDKSVLLLSICALASLVISSAGPFRLAYILATKTGDAIAFRDAIYTYLHFQYNGFFTLSVFALLFHNKFNHQPAAIKKRMHQFASFLCLSVIPALFLSLLWHSYNSYIRVFAFVGCALIVITIICFGRLAVAMKNVIANSTPFARTLLVFSMMSFIVKMILQTGTIVPSLGNAVFGYRPIIIGFLHLVFLGLVTFYILANFIEDSVFSFEISASKTAVVFFSMAIILNEVILLVNGIGLLLHTSSPVYGWLLWIAAICLLVGAILLTIARFKTVDMVAAIQPDAPIRY